ncbi:MAG: hypothetical protein Q8K75_05035 [Chlamydiales bacterium]|nr:hypothetical protein [Chlamydiales bacterium]
MEKQIFSGVPGHWGYWQFPQPGYQYAEDHIGRMEKMLSGTVGVKTRLSEGAYRRCLENLQKAGQEFTLFCNSLNMVVVNPLEGVLMDRLAVFNCTLCEALQDLPD